MCHYSNTLSPTLSPCCDSCIPWLKLFWFWTDSGKARVTSCSLAWPAEVTLSTGGVGSLLGTLNLNPHSRSLPWWSDTMGRHTSTSPIWVKRPRETHSKMTQFCPSGREKKRRKRFRSWWEIPIQVKPRGEVRSPFLPLASGTESSLMWLTRHQN